MTKPILSLIVFIFLFAGLREAPAAEVKLVDVIDKRLSWNLIDETACKCISILPTDQIDPQRSAFDVINDCEYYDVSVGFAGDIARLRPDFIIKAWGKSA